MLQEQAGDALMLVLAAGKPAAEDAARIDGASQFAEFEFGGRRFMTLPLAKSSEPVPLMHWPKRFGLPTTSDVRALGEAIAGMRQRAPQAEVASALFVPALEACLRVKDAEAAEDIGQVAAQLLTASQASALDVGSVRGANPWVSADDIAFFLSALGVSELAEPVAPEAFALPGRPALEAFFREYVIEPSADPERYQALRVQLPNGILLYGPPGSGKTHAVDTLVGALRRPTFRLDLGEVGSPFIHQTTVAMRQAFEQAKRSAPSLLVLEEIDAVAPARGPMSQDHKVEELTEILRMIEAAAKNGVLVLATTNRKEALDPAVLRTGRFDHSVLVDYPTKEEVELALQGMLKDRPHDPLDLSGASRALAGRPMSDAAWIVNEAARLTARAKQDRISADALRQALKRLQLSPSTGADAT
ncbi:ATP-binding protein [Bradyrhizobium diazoefficiens]|uniref:ATP-binding protein n=1 Tax=Bradyrhizobium diazoefficiens TaxID=1355477 RepID=UPI00271481B8|nr:AAA family ATPase [Bradyrhizobium diazoefficiens]WLC16662.1 AAA family ATPase [Bradyrhizobium diazoefficiens]